MPINTDDLRDVGSPLLADEIDALRAALDRKRHEIDDVEERGRVRVCALEQMIADLRETHGRLTERVSELESERDRWERLAGTFEAQRDTTVVQKGAVDAKAKRLQADRDQLRDQVEALRALWSAYEQRAANPGLNTGSASQDAQHLRLAYEKARALGALGPA